MASSPPETNVENEDAEFSAEFERLAAARDGTAPREQTPPDDKAKPEGNAPEDKPAPDPAPAQSDEDGTSGDSANGDGSEPPPEDKAPDDPWKDVPDDIRTRIAAIEKERDEAQHRAKSDAERVSALSRKIAQLSSAQPTGKAPEKKDEPSEAQKVLDAKIAQLREDYPEVAEPVLELLAAQRAEVGKVKEQLETVATERQAAYVEQQQALLETLHPDWQQVAATTDFQAWMTEQPQGIRNLAESWDARETATVISLFKTEAGLVANREEPPAKEATPEQKAAEARRKDQLAGGREVKSKPVSVASGPPEDFDEAVLYYQAKKDAEMAAERRR